MPTGLPLGVDAALRQTDRIHQLFHALLDVLPVLDEVVGDDGLGDDLADRHAWVERGVRILKDHLRPRAHLFHLRGAELIDVLSVEQHLTGGRLEQVEHQTAEGGFAAAGFAHDAQRLSLGD